MRNGSPPSSAGGSSAPTSAHGTLMPARTFGAPQTMSSVSPRAGVDLADAQPVGVRMRLDLEHLADDDAA